MSERTISEEKKRAGNRGTAERKSFMPATGRGEPLRSAGSSADQFKHLQRVIGNHAALRALRSARVQAKLTVSSPDDSYEQEADRVAERVMGMPEPDISRQEENEELQTSPLADQISPLVQTQPEAEEAQRQPEEEEEPAQAQFLQKQEEEEMQKQPEKEEEPVQAKLLQRREERAAVEKKSNSVQEGRGASLESSINSIRGGGRPLTQSARFFFEPRFGADFSGVKVHTDENANHLAKSINAKAFTIGRDIVFGSGQYSPESPPGKQILAHELTHVIQQAGKSQNTIQRLKTPNCEKTHNIPISKNVEFSGSYYSETFIKTDSSPTTVEVFAREKKTSRQLYFFEARLVSCPQSALGTYQKGNLPANMSFTLSQPGKYHLHLTSNCPGRLKVYYSVK